MVNTLRTLGCTSDGQLIRLAMPSAINLGIQIHILGKSITSSVGKLIGGEFGPASFTCIDNGNWGGETSLEEFLQKVGEGNPITTEWENVPAEALEHLEKYGAIIRPNISVIRTIQDRKTEKELAEKAWGKTVQYRIIDSKIDLTDGVKELGDCILKTRKSGYDGKGQWKISSNTDLEQLWNESTLQNGLKNGGFILEKKIDLDFEASVIVGIDIAGNIKSFDPIYNIHENGILRYSISPAPINSDLNKRIQAEGEKIASGISKNVGGYVGLLTIEFFATKEGEILVNEFAPRPHNSGHITLDSHTESQNDVWLQAVIGDTFRNMDISVTNPGVMENILSQQEMIGALIKLDQTRKGFQDVSLYNYEKVKTPDSRNTDTRKLGHLNYLGGRIEEGIEKVRKGELSLEGLLRLLK